MISVAANVNTADAPAGVRAFRDAKESQAEGQTGERRLVSIATRS